MGRKHTNIEIHAEIFINSKKTINPDPRSSINSMHQKDEENCFKTHHNQFLKINNKEESLKKQEEKDTLSTIE